MGGRVRRLLWFAFALWLGFRMGSSTIVVECSEETEPEDVPEEPTRRERGVWL